MDYLSFENFLFDKSTKIKSISELDQVVDVPTVIFIEEIKHALVLFPNGHIFNCNPRDYPLKIDKTMTEGLRSLQVEPSDEEYEEYWNSSNDPFIQNDQNCLLWCEYYLDWVSNRKNETFPCSLFDLEKWSLKTMLTS